MDPINAPFLSVMTNEIKKLGAKSVLATAAEDIPANSKVGFDYAGEIIPIQAEKAILEIGIASSIHSIKRLINNQKYIAILGYDGTSNLIMHTYNTETGEVSSSFQIDTSSASGYGLADMDVCDDGGVDKAFVAFRDTGYSNYLYGIVVVFDSDGGMTKGSKSAVRTTSASDSIYVKQIKDKRFFVRDNVTDYRLVKIDLTSDFSVGPTTSFSGFGSYANVAWTDDATNKLVLAGHDRLSYTTWNETSLEMATPTSLATSLVNADSTVYNFNPNVVVDDSDPEDIKIVCFTVRNLGTPPSDAPAYVIYSYDSVANTATAAFTTLSQIDVIKLDGTTTDVTAWKCVNCFKVAKDHLVFQLGYTYSDTITRYAHFEWIVKWTGSDIEVVSSKSIQNITATDTYSQTEYPRILGGNGNTYFAPQQKRDSVGGTGGHYSFLHKVPYLTAVGFVPAETSKGATAKVYLDGPITGTGFTAGEKLFIQTPFILTKTNVSGGCTDSSDYETSIWEIINPSPTIKAYSRNFTSNLKMLADLTTQLEI